MVASGTARAASGTLVRACAGTLKNALRTAVLGGQVLGKTVGESGPKAAVAELQTSDCAVLHSTEFFVLILRLGLEAQIGARPVGPDSDRKLGALQVLSDVEARVLACGSR